MASGGPGTAELWSPTVGTSGNNGAGWIKPHDNRDGFDLVWRQRYLSEQMAKVEDDIRTIEQNANLSDTDKMFAMQMAMNTWSAISNLRTNMLKVVSDTLKAIVRNIS